MWQWSFTGSYFDSYYSFSLNPVRISFKKSSKWYQADRLSATFLMAYNVSKIFYFLSESGPRQFSVLALGDLFLASI